MIDVSGSAAELFSRVDPTIVALEPDTVSVRPRSVDSLVALTGIELANRDSGRFRRRPESPFLYGFFAFSNLGYPFESRRTLRNPLDGALRGQTLSLEHSHLQLQTA